MWWLANSGQGTRGHHVLFYSELKTHVDDSRILNLTTSIIIERSKISGYQN